MVLACKIEIPVLEEEDQRSNLMISKLSIVAIAIFLLAAMGFAQEKELFLDEGEKPHKNIDAIYKTFRDGYCTLKPEFVADLYSEDAAYCRIRRLSADGRQFQIIALHSLPA